MKHESDGGRCSGNGGPAGRPGLPCCCGAAAAARPPSLPPLPSLTPNLFLPHPLASTTPLSDLTTSPTPDIHSHLTCLPPPPHPPAPTTPQCIQQSQAKRFFSKPLHSPLPLLPFTLHILYSSTTSVITFFFLICVCVIVSWEAPQISLVYNRSDRVGVVSMAASSPCLYWPWPAYSCMILTLTLYSQ